MDAIENSPIQIDSMMLVEIIRAVISSSMSKGLVIEYNWISHALNKFPMMTSSSGTIFRVIAPLCGHRWIPLTKVNDAELWYFLWSAPE